jgi:gamma-glutamyltranspeptidase/glutathione hydrolase
VCSLAGGAYLTVAAPRQPAASIDAQVEMPGRGLPRDLFERGLWEVTTDYAGGTTTVIGHGSVATPGALAGLAEAHRRWGQAPWRDVVEPAIVAARDGFPLGRSNHHYLEFVHEVVYGWHPPSHAAIHDADGALVPAGATIRLPDLADTLEAIASEGPDLLYRGELGAMVAEDVAEHDGILTRADLEAYEVDLRPARSFDMHGWRVAVPPPPSIGGATLGAALLLLGARPGAGGWRPDDIRRQIEVQAAVVTRRAGRLDLAEDLREQAEQFLADAADGDLARFRTSPSTIHVSATDADGLAVAITASSGYGSGAMPPGTGLWLNNCLGELELNRRGIHALAPGTRLPSNMSPTVVTGHGQTLAVGSPGADRITSALLQVLAGFVHGGMDLDEAIAHPRAHVSLDGDGDPAVAYEEDLDPEGLDDLPWPTRVFPPHSMSFGGVGAALRGADGRLRAGSDPRRDGVALTT